MSKSKKLDVWNRILGGIFLAVQSALLWVSNGFEIWWKVAGLLLVILIGLYGVPSGIFRWKLEKLRRNGEPVGSDIEEIDRELDERYRLGRVGSPSRWYWRNTKDISSIYSFASIFCGLILFDTPVATSVDWMTWMTKGMGILSILGGLSGLYLNIWIRSRIDIRIEVSRSGRRTRELEKGNFEKG